MQRRLDLLASEAFDLLIVGGGIAGLMAACDGAQRGLRTALVERDDFGAGSSFNNLKTVHGGLRSLQTLDIARARESIVERRALARIAPHLVAPQPFLIATGAGLTRSRPVFEAAFLIDRLLTRDKNAGVETALHLPRGRVVSRDICERLFPGVRNGATGGAMWYDYQVRSVERLNMAIAHAAAAHGARLVNHAEAVEALRSGDRIAGMRVRDVLSGTETDVRAAVTLNASGGAASAVLRMFGTKPDLPLLKAMNLVSSRAAGDVALGAPTPDGRMLFMVPWQGRAMFGTSHSSSLVGENEGVSREDLARFLKEVNGAFPALGLRESEVTLVHRGLVPAAGHPHAPDLRSTPDIRDHASEGTQGAVSAVAVKYTTGRRVAELAIDCVVAKLGRGVEPCRTGLTPLPGAEIADFEAILRETMRGASIHLEQSSQKRLMTIYGSRLGGVVDLAIRHAEWAAPLSDRTAAIGAEVIHAVRAEMACTLADIVLRRTTLGSAGYPGDEIVDACANLAAVELGWDRERKVREIDELKRFYLPVGPLAADS
jgi:glycerol-3-phosphate dehydrogenase